MSRLLVAAALLGCSGTPAPPESEPESASQSESESQSASQSESESQSESASESASESESESADALAREVWRAAGGEHLDEVAQLDFRFVVTDAGETVFEAAHRWDRRTGRDRVSWTDREGTLREAVVTLADRSACGHVGGAAAEGEARAALAEAAYGRWVNDAYWLMVPLKVLDPGVTRRALEPEGERRRLELTFAGVGLTPGDRYVLFIDPEGRLTRWEMSLEGAAPGDEPKGVTFEGHRAVGPLTLPLEHTSEGEGERRILLQDVVAHESVQAEAFVLRGCPAG